MNFYDTLRKDGYVVIPQVIEPGVTKKIRKLHNTISKKSGLTTLLPSEILKNEFLINLILSEKIINPLKSIFNKNFSILPNFTIRESIYIPWHNDAYFLPDEVWRKNSEIEFLQCAIYLQDNDSITGGGVSLLPGSHLLKKEEVNLLLKNFEINKKDIMNKSGDLVVWDNRITHKSTSSFENPNDVKLAFQWTVSASKKHVSYYIDYLKERSKKNIHVSDFLNKSPKPYFCDMPNIKFPKSFNESTIELMKKMEIEFIGF